MKEEFLKMCYECGVADALYTKRDKRGNVSNNTPPNWMNAAEAEFWQMAYNKTLKLF